MRQFDPGAVQVIFVVNNVPLGQVFLWLLRFFLVISMPPMFHTRTDSAVDSV